MIKALKRDASTAHWLAEPKIFAPTQTPFPGARDGQHLISWRWSLSLPTDRPVATFKHEEALASSFLVV